MQQLRLLELAVEGDPVAQRLFDRGGRREKTVEIGARAAASRQLARHRERLAAALEERLHDGPIGALADELVAALLAHEQPDRLGEQRLAGAGLAGDHVEARATKSQPRLGDQDEVVDGQAQRASLLRLKSFSSTFW